MLGNNIEDMVLIAASVCICPTQSCPTLCSLMDCNPPGSSVHGILQARILEWVAIPFSRRSSQPRDQTWVSGSAGGFFTTEPLVKHQSMMLYRVATSSSLPEEGSLGLPRKAVPPRSKSTQGLGDPTYPGGVPSLPSPPEDLYAIISG